MAQRVLDNLIEALNDIRNESVNRYNQDKTRRNDLASEAAIDNHERSKEVRSLSSHMEVLDLFNTNIAHTNYWAGSFAAWGKDKHEYASDVHDRACRAYCVASSEYVKALMQDTENKLVKKLHEKIEELAATKSEAAQATNNWKAKESAMLKAFHQKVEELAGAKSKAAQGDNNWKEKERYMLNELGDTKSKLAWAERKECDVLNELHDTKLKLAWAEREASRFRHMSPDTPLELARAEQDWKEQERMLNLKLFVAEREAARARHMSYMSKDTELKLNEELKQAQKKNRETLVAQAELVARLKAADARLHVDAQAQITPIQEKLTWGNPKHTSFMDELRSNPHILAKCPDACQIADGVEKAVASWRKDGKKNMCGLDDDEVQSIAAYSYDLKQPDNKKEGNLYFEENKDLRLREPKERQEMKRAWEVHMHFMMRGLAKLPDFKGTVYRGSPDKEAIEKKYKPNTNVQWGAWTSTSKEEQTAQWFAGPGGVVFEIAVCTGKDIQEFSLISAEDEILLSPDSKFYVRSSEQHGDYLYVVMEEITGSIVS